MNPVVAFVVNVKNVSLVGESTIDNNYGEILESLKEIIFLKDTDKTKSHEIVE